MAPAVVYEGVARRAQDASSDQLFAGKKLWFSQMVPQRQWLIQQAENNGATIVRLEKQADVLLVDHARKNQAPGTHSWKYVTDSISKGKLENLDDHTVGSVSRVDRPVGSARTAAKGTRTPFTEADDQLLWNWVKPYADLGGQWKGNEIYKQLEQQNQRHTFQSWRDRWMKHTQYQTRQVTTQIGPAYETVPVLPHLTNASTNTEHEERLATHEGSGTNEANKPVTRVAKASAMGNEQSSLSAKQPSIVSVREEDQAQAELGSEHEPGGNNSIVSNGNISTDARLAQRDSHKFSHEKDSDMSRVGKRNSQRDHDLDNPLTRSTKRQSSKRKFTVPVDQKPLPLAYNFTQEIAWQLYISVPFIINTNKSTRDARWSKFAADYPGHGDQKTWINYYDNVILPEYIDRKGLKDPEKLKEHVARKVREDKAREARSQGRRLSVGMLESNVVDTSTQQSSTLDNQDKNDARADNDDIGKMPIKIARTECANCFTTTTPRWRKDVQGRDLCDACGRFLKKNGIMRPSATWTEPPIPDDVDGLREDLEQNEQDPVTNDGSEYGHDRASDQLVSQQSMPASIQRPPGPNESRKRSQGRSTQSDSQSQPKSQSTTTSGTVSDIPYRADWTQSISQKVDTNVNTQQEVSGPAEASLDAQGVVLTPKRNRNDSGTDPDIISPKRRRMQSNTNRSKSPRPASIISLPSSLSDNGEDEDLEQDADDLPHSHEQGISNIDSPELGPRRLMALDLPDAEDSPLFIPEEAENEGHLDDPSSPSSKSMGPDDVAFANFLTSDVNNKGNSRGSSSASVNLVNEEDIDVDLEAGSSDYAPSEARSEGLQFGDTSPELSQAWDTAPRSRNETDDIETAEEADNKQNEDKLDGSGFTADQVKRRTVEKHLNAQEKTSESDMVAEKASQAIPPPTEHSDTTEHGHDTLFETAPEAIRSQSGADSTGNRDGSNKVKDLNSNRLDTQALLQQSISTTVEDDSFLIPPPEGGWETDSELEVVGENVNDPSSSTLVPIRPEKGTSPTHVDEHSLSDPETTSEDDPDKIDQFIIKQKELYSSKDMDDAILEAIAIKALESTCLEIKLAGYVVKAMVRRYIKGKSKDDNQGLDGHNSSSSGTTPNGNSRRKSPTKRSRRDNDKLVGRLVPSNMRGVWTTQDDDWLQGVDARSVKKVDDKHGEDGIKARFEYLDELYRQ